MISVIIPTLNAEAELPGTLGSLVSAAVAGVVREVIIVDGGSRDRTVQVADLTGAEVIKSEPAHGLQLAAGAARARSRWLMFLEAGTELEAGWEREASGLMAEIESGHHREVAAAFRFALDDRGLSARLFEGAVAARSAAFRLPCREQGLLISRTLYEQLGGHRPLPLLEDVDIARRIGRSRVSLLRARAVARPSRDKRYLRRVVRDQICLALYSARVSPHAIAKLYQRQLLHLAQPVQQTTSY